MKITFRVLFSFPQYIPESLCVYPLQLTITTVSYQLLLFHFLLDKMSQELNKKASINGCPGTWLEGLGGNWFFRWG